MSTIVSSDEQKSIWQHLYRGDGKRLFTDQHKNGDLVEVNGRNGRVDSIVKHIVSVRFTNGMDYDYMDYHIRNVFPRQIQPEDIFVMSGHCTIIQYTTTTKNTDSYMQKRKIAKEAREQEIRTHRAEVEHIQQVVVKIQQLMLSSCEDAKKLEEYSKKMVKLISQQGKHKQLVKELKRSALKIEYEEETVTTTYSFKENKLMWCKELCDKYPIIFTERIETVEPEKQTAVKQVTRKVRAVLAREPC